MVSYLNVLLLTLFVKETQGYTHRLDAHTHTHSLNCSFVKYFNYLKAQALKKKKKSKYHT